MAAIPKLQATKEPPILLDEVLRLEDYTTTRVTNTYSIEGDIINKKQDLPFCPDATNVERLIRVLDTWNNACCPEILNISGEARHKRAREVLRGDVQATWDEHIKNILPTNQENASFIKNCRSFLLNFLPSNSFLVQEEYFYNTTTSFNLSCFATASRLRLINNLTVYLPGSGGQKLYNTETAMKNAFYKLMHPNWQLQFTNTGHDLSDSNYTLQKLVSFMEQQRLFQQTTQPRKQQRRFAGRTGAAARYRPYMTVSGTVCRNPPLQGRGQYPSARTPTPNPSRQGTSPTYSSCYGSSTRQNPSRGSNGRFSNTDRSQGEYNLRPWGPIPPNEQNANRNLHTSLTCYEDGHLDQNQDNQNDSFFEGRDTDVYSEALNDTNVHDFDQSNYQDHNMFFGQDQSNMEPPHFDCEEASQYDLPEDQYHQY